MPSDPVTLTATYRIVTPMFIGDANQNATGISPAAVKGALRFWWRALNWGRMKGEQSDEIALKCLYQEEVRLFGGMAEQGGQGCFLLRHHFSGKKIVTNWPNQNNGSKYLGFGLWETNTTKQRNAIEENQEFTIELVMKHSTTEEQIKQLNEILGVFGLFGGLGSRARRGFGSVALINLNGGSSICDSSKKYLEDAGKLISEYGQIEELPPYTAISKNALCAVICDGADARSVHNKLGLHYQSVRGQHALRGRAKIPFGLPLKGIDEQNRRASPLIMHLHPIKEKIIAVAIFMPSIFHYKYKDLSSNVVKEFFSGIREKVI